MEDTTKKEAEIYSAMGCTTPDSGIDFSKFDIVDFILSDEMEIPHEEAVTWDVSNVVSPQDTSSDLPELSLNSLIPPAAESQDAKPWTENYVVSTTPTRSGPQLRTLTKLEFDRTKAIQDTKREEEQQTKFQRSILQSNPVDLPVSTSPKVAAIPQKLLKNVETRLENPTTYYLEQRVRHSIAALYVNDGSSIHGGSVPPIHTQDRNSLHGGQPGRLAQTNGLTLTGPGSAPPNIFSSTPLSPLTTKPLLQLNTGVPPSPGPTNSSVATSLTSGCSESFEPFTGLEGEPDISTISLSEIHEIISQDGEGLFSYANSSLPPKYNGQRGQEGKTLASSAPLESPETPQPGEHFRTSKDRQKKDNHNKIERRRRFLINDMITVQGKQLPKQGDPHFDRIGDVKLNKGAILQASVEYLNILKAENEHFRQKESQSQLENKKLLLRIKELENLCQEGGISLPQQSLTWKSPPPERLNSLINGEIRIKEEPDQQRIYCELMEDDRNIVTGPCDPMLTPCQADPEDIGLAAALESQDFSDDMEFT